MAAIPLVLLITFRDARASLSATIAAGSFREALSQAAGKSDLRRSMVFIAFLLATVAVTYLAGQLVALPVFVIAYLLSWGRCRVRDALIYAACTYLMIWGFYGELMNLLFHPSLFF
jgi:hypothetical protein